MKYRISHPTKKLLGSIELTPSKSISNRALIIQSLCSEKFEIKNLATADDTLVLKQILTSLTNSTEASETTYDIGASGTAMRFLTAVFSTKKGTHILTGTPRMKKRPIGILVNALRDLGGDIEYLEEEGFPPLKITGKTLTGTEIEMDGNVSSQFISALLLISPELPNGLVIKFTGEVTSRPYVNMTLKMMEEFRVYGQWHENFISVSKQQYHKKSEPYYLFEVEADWSSAAYWHAIAALAKEVDFTIKGLKHPSLQGDSIVGDIFTFLGVKTEKIENGIHLKKIKSNKEHFGFDFSDCPDLAQTCAVAVSALNIPALFNGVHTLRIKETDRIIALKNELSKLGVEVEILNDNSIEINPQSTLLPSASPINTYDDHRMAMAFAVLAMKLDSITIEHPEVVKKSYPDFWNDLKNVGFIIEEV
ncbi:MAG: 3-phosphoshikimate 1-carboxyvinyltransferase [Bacteroidia bacterium]|nr:3-phosphoshikimate 1-carboxyvinyltransferase [Bacteroidia bacterium]